MRQVDIEPNPTLVLGWPFGPESARWDEYFLVALTRREPMGVTEFGILRDTKSPLCLYS